MCRTGVLGLEVVGRPGLPPLQFLAESLTNYTLQRQTGRLIVLYPEH